LRQRIVDELVVPLAVGLAWQVGPLGTQDAQVVGVGQGTLPVFAGAEFGFFAVHTVGEHGDRVAHLVVGLLGGSGWQAGPFTLHALAAGQLRVGPGAGPRVGLPGLDGYLGAVLVLHTLMGDRDGGVVGDAPGHGDI